MLTEQGRTFLRFGEGLHTSEFRVCIAQQHGGDAHIFKKAEDLDPGFRHELVREEITIAEDDAKRLRGLCFHILLDVFGSGAQGWFTAR